VVLRAPYRSKSHLFDSLYRHIDSDSVLASPAKLQLVQQGGAQVLEFVQSRQRFRVPVSISEFNVIDGQRMDLPVQTVNF